MAYRRYQSRYVNAVLLLIGINLLLFIATMIHNDLIFLLGLYPAGLIERPWTMVTNLFIHGGIGHIIANMLTLYFFGTYLARLIGEKKFLIIYFLGGILGNIFYIFLSSPFTIAIGASGAVFALGGVLTAMTPKLRVFVFPIPVPLPLWTAVIGGFVIISLFPHVAWQAHLGGLVTGLIAGLILRKRRRPIF
ncbi:hypothetical protein ES708_33462 [subsurface metagenome]